MPLHLDTARLTVDTRSTPVRAAVIALLCALGVLIMSGGALAQSKPSATVAAENSVASSFESAARRWGVPMPLLMAVGWVESHWEQRNGEPAADGSYGIMHVGAAGSDTMERAASLTGLTSDSVRFFEQANIEAGAALLSDISRKISNTKGDPTNLSDWYEAVAEYSGSTEPTVRDGYAQEVFRIIKEGVSARLLSGEEIALTPSAVSNLPAPMRPGPSSDDYPPALWVPAHPNGYTVGRPYPPLDKVIIHDTEGSYASAISWFQNPNSGVATQYVIRSSDGQITQMVREANTGYHAGNWDYNVRSIGIEHEGYASQPGWYTEAMYQSSAALVRDVTEQYAIKKDRANIVGHYQVPNQSHTDPGPYWNWTYYMSLVRRDGQRAALVDNTDPGFAPVPSQIDPQHFWWVYDNGYNGSNTYVTTSVVNQSSSENSATWSAVMPTTGYYDVYAFVPWVDNNTADTASARYRVAAADGERLVNVSQKAITDVGNGSWAHIGKFLFNAGAQARIGLADWTGEAGRNVWFDAVMWIPALNGNPPPPIPTAPPTQPPAPTNTPTRTPTNAPPNTPTWTPSATLPPQPTWTPGPCGMRFTDMPADHWAYGYVNYLYCRGAIRGYDDGTFRPGNGSTRAQFTKLLVVSLGWTPYAPALPTFSDVPLGSTFYPYVEAAVERGVITGYPDGTFRPGDMLTRAQAAKILVLGKGWNLLTPITPSFTDVPPGHWAYSYIETAQFHGIVEGHPDGTFGVGEAVTRAQLAKMVALTAQAPR